MPAHPLQRLMSEERSACPGVAGAGLSAFTPIEGTRLDIKADRQPDGLEENPNRLKERDINARWLKKNGIDHYGDKNSICIHAERSFIKRFFATIE